MSETSRSSFTTSGGNIRPHPSDVLRLVGDDTAALRQDPCPPFPVTAGCLIAAACFNPKTVFNPSVMSAHTTPSQSAEDYLERIHELIEAKGYARVVDIASSLKVRQASVTSMVQKLDRAGFVKYEKYRGLLLTDQGRAVACNIQNRHATLSRFFSLFGLDAETQRADIEGIEHHLSPATLEMLADLAGFFEQDSEALRAFKQSRKRGKKK